MVEEIKSYIKKMRSNYALVGFIRKGNFHIARYVLVGPVINSSNDKQRNNYITGRGIFNPICPSFATPDATPNKKWATA